MPGDDDQTRREDRRGKWDEWVKKQGRRPVIVNEMIRRFLGTE